MSERKHLNERKSSSRKKENPSDILFSGNPQLFGGLTNEDELARKCPQKFLDRNPWSDYASKVFFNGADVSNWQWKTEDGEVRRKQFGCLRGLLGTFAIKHEDKEAVAGWMLSEMLTEVPQYLPPKSS